MISSTILKRFIGWDIIAMWNSWQSALRTQREGERLITILPSHRLRIRKRLCTPQLEEEETFCTVMPIPHLTLVKTSFYRKLISQYFYVLYTECEECGIITYGLDTECLTKVSWVRWWPDHGSTILISGLPTEELTAKSAVTRCDLTGSGYMAMEAMSSSLIPPSSLCFLIIIRGAAFLGHIHSLWYFCLEARWPRNEPTKIMR